MTRTWLNAQLQGLAINPAAPPEVLIRLAASNDAGTELARRHRLPDAAAATLAASTSTEVRTWLAWHPTLPAEVQAFLAADPEPQVRTNLAQGADYFTGAGISSRHIPAPLPRTVYEALARDTDPTVRRALGFNHHLPQDLRAALVEDPDPEVAAVAIDNWRPISAAHAEQLLARTAGSNRRHRVLANLNEPLPAHVVRALLAELDWASDTSEADQWMLEHLAEVADLDETLTGRFLAEADLRAHVAANPTLAADHVAALARDPDNDVRMAVVARDGLDPQLRESIDVTYDERSTDGVSWADDQGLSGQALLALAHSRHWAIRKSLAARPNLPADVLDVLAHDDSFVVRLFVAERQTAAPGWLLAEVAAQWTGYSRWDMLGHPDFPADAAVALAGSEQAGARQAAARHPGLPMEVIETLLRDSGRQVRRCAAANVAVPAGRLRELLAIPDVCTALGAASNPTLPVAAMEEILAAAGL